LKFGIYIYQVATLYDTTALATTVGLQDHGPERNADKPPKRSR